MITGGDEGLARKARRRRLGSTVMNGQCTNLILDRNAGQRRKTLQKPELRLAKEAFLGRRQRGAAPFPTVQTQQVNPRNSCVPAQIGQPPSAHDVDVRSPMASKAAQHPVYQRVETDSVRLIDHGHQRAVKIQD